MSSRHEASTVVVNVSLDVPFDDVAGELSAAGLHVRSSLDLIGIVTGEIAINDLPELSAVPGVAAVERDRTVEALPMQPDTSRAAPRPQKPATKKPAAKKPAKSKRGPPTPK